MWINMEILITQSTVYLLIFNAFMRVLLTGVGLKVRGAGMKRRVDCYKNNFIFSI